MLGMFGMQQSKSAYMKVEVDGKVFIVKTEEIGKLAEVLLYDFSLGHRASLVNLPMTHEEEDSKGAVIFFKERPDVTIQILRGDVGPILEPYDAVEARIKWLLVHTDTTPEVAREQAIAELQPFCDNIDLRNISAPEPKAPSTMEELVETLAQAAQDAIEEIEGEELEEE